MAKAELVFVATTDGLFILSNPGSIGRWLKAGHALQSHAVTAIWANPTDPTMLIASSHTTSWQSTDGGQQWHLISMPAMQQFIASRHTPSRILARDDTCAYLSIDAGTSWQTLAPATHISAGGDLLWYGNATMGQLSVDGGQTWNHTPSGHIICLSNDGAQRLTYNNHQQWVGDADLAQPPAGWQASVLLAGTPTCLLGIANQCMWSYQTTWQPSTPAITPRVIHPTTYHPDRVWIGDSTGMLWHSTNRGNDWQSVGAGFLQINAIASARLI